MQGLYASCFLPLGQAAHAMLAPIPPRPEGKGLSLHG